MRKKLEAAKKTLETLKKDTPTLGLTVASLHEVLAAHKKASQTRLDRTNTYRTAASERRQERADKV